MRTFLNIIKNISALLLGIISCVFILIYIGLNTTENLISKQNIVDTVKNIDIVEIVGKENKQEIYSILQQADIPTEYIDAMLEDEQLKETVGEYVAISLEYVLSEDKEVPKIDKTKFTEVLILSFDRVIEVANNHKIEVSKYITKEEQELIHEKIEYYVPEVVEKIPEVQEFIENQVVQDSNFIEAKEKMEEIEQTIDIIQMVYSYKNVLLIGVIVPLLLIALIKYQNCRFIKWMAFPFLGAFAFLKLIYTFVPYVLDSQMPSDFTKVKSIIEPSIQTLLSGINEATLLCFIIGIGLIAVQFVISLYVRKRIVL